LKMKLTQDAPTFDESCMEGHVACLEMLNNREIQDDRHTESVRVVNPTRRQLMMSTDGKSPRLRVALAEFRYVGGDLIAFCRKNFARFNYSCWSSMYNSMKIGKIRSIKTS